MRKLIFMSLLSTTLLALQCKKQKSIEAANCIKARLEIKGICMNYVIKVLEGDMDYGKIEANWTDPASGKSYANVFALANRCTMPADIKEGDEFYFIVNEKPDNSTCMVCDAYRPVPEKKLSITVSKIPCK